MIKKLIEKIKQPVKLWESGDLGDYVRSVSWSPDGSKLATGTGWYSSDHGRLLFLIVMVLSYGRVKI